MSSETPITLNAEGTSDIPVASTPIEEPLEIPPAAIEEQEEAVNVTTVTTSENNPNPVTPDALDLKRGRMLSIAPTMTRDTIDKILKKNDRTDDEALILLDQIKDFKFFNQVLKDKNEPESVLTVVKSLKYRKIKAGRPVFIEGDPSNGNVFVVYSGELLVMVKKLDPIAEANLAVSNLVPHFEVPAPVLTTQTSTCSEDAPLYTEEQVKPERGSIAPQKNNKHKKRADAKKEDISDVGIIGSESDASKTHLPNVRDRRTILESSFVFAKEPSMKKVKSQKVKVEKDKDADNDESPYEHGYVKDKITKGGCFGEVAIESGSKRSATILASTDCELLVLSAKVFNSLRNEYDRKVRKLLDFITLKLPGLNQVNTKNVIKNYFYLFEEKEYFYGNHITIEGEKGENLYIIYEGSCEVYRTVRIQESETLPVLYSKIKSSFFSQAHTVKEKIPLTILKDGALVGEELLFTEEEPTYSYSVQVMSDNCKVVCVNKSIFAFRFPKEVLLRMQEDLEEKKSYKNNLLIQNLEKRDVHTLRGAIDDRFLLVQRSSQKDFGAKSPKININPSQYTSYKLMMNENSFDESPGQTSNTNITLPKINKKKNLPLLDHIETEKKKKLMPFSRVNLIPATKEKESDPDGNDEEKVIKLKESRENTGKNTPADVFDKKSFVDHIRKSDGITKFHDMNDVYDSLGAKLKLNPHLDVHKANVNNIGYYKLDFGKTYDIEERANYLAKNRTLIKEAKEAKEKSHLTIEQCSPADVTSVQGKHQKNNSLSKFDGAPASVKKLGKYLKGVDVNKLQSSKNSIQLKLPESTGKDSISAFESEIIKVQEPSLDAFSPIKRFSKFEPSFLKDFSPKSKINSRINNRSCDNLPSYRSSKSKATSPKNRDEPRLESLAEASKMEKPVVSYDLGMMDLIAMKETLSKETNLDVFRRQALPVKNLNLISPDSKVKPDRVFMGHARKM